MIEDVEITKQIIAQERPVRTRVSVLQAPGSVDFKKMLETLKGILRAEDMQKKIALQKQVQERKKATQKHDIYDVPEDQFWKAKMKGSEDRRPWNRYSRYIRCS